MARKAAPGTLVHCDACGEDYSATYKRCPFCGEKSENWSTAPIPPVDGGDEDDFVFDGQDLFESDSDDQPRRPARPRGGKRLAQEEAPGPINWPRLITFLCSLVIIAAALVIVFAYIYPKIHNPDSDPAGSQQVDSPPPVSEAPSNDPSALPSGEPSADPSAQPSDDPAVTPSQTPSGVTGLTLSKTDMTLKASEQWTLEAAVAPANWDGTVTWSSSDTSVATVSANGTVTNVNTGSKIRNATITATAGDRTATCIVRCRGGSSGSASSSEPPVSGGLTLSRSDFTLNDTWPTYTFGVTGASGAVTWSSSDDSVASIDQNGKVTKVGAGTCTITATDASGQKATCIVRVK